ncbi:MAG: Dyp-type peroxidase [Chloroflexota bacterium]
MGLISPQFGIFAQGTHAHHYLEFDLRPGVSVEQAIAAFRRLRAPEVASGGVNLVIAFRGELWREFAPGLAPASTEQFRAIAGADGHNAPATPHDVWIWISGSAPDETWRHARAAVLAVDDVAILAFEQPAFTYLDSRDLTGFIDGTENPPVRRAADVAIIPPGEPGEGGSHVIAMRWVHDLDAFNRLPVAEQQNVFGRTKVDSIEMSDAEKPLTAHIARVTLEAAEGELEIFRRSVPYGTVGEYGLYFVAFSADPTRYDRMLARMFGTTDRVRDRLTDFTRPVSGAYYFAPSYNALNQLAGPEEG